MERVIICHSCRFATSHDTLHVTNSFQVMRKYHVQRREDYTKYNKICGTIKSLAARIKDLPANNTLRSESSASLIQKLYNMGILPTAQSLAQAESVTVSSICRRRLPVLMVKMKMAQSVRTTKCTLKCFLEL